MSASSTPRQLQDAWLLLVDRIAFAKSAIQLACSIDEEWSSFAAVTKPWQKVHHASLVLTAVVVFQSIVEKKGNVNGLALYWKSADESFRRNWNTEYELLVNQKSNPLAQFRHNLLAHVNYKLASGEGSLPPLSPSDIAGWLNRLDSLTQALGAHLKKPPTSYADVDNCELRDRLRALARTTDPS